MTESISDKVANDYELTEKLNSIVCKTLGSSLEHSLEIKFDYEIAKQSLRLYKHQDISKIETINIPSEISEVRYKSDLTETKHIDINKLTDKRKLFNAI